MHKSATKCNETLGKWCKNKHGASKIIDTLETYHPPHGINTQTPSFSLSSSVPLILHRPTTTYNHRCFWFLHKLLSIMSMAQEFSYPDLRTTWHNASVNVLRCFTRKIATWALFKGSSWFAYFSKHMNTKKVEMGYHILRKHDFIHVALLCCRKKQWFLEKNFKE
jgi:hypothetical protein